MRRSIFLFILLGLTTTGCVDRDKSILMAAGSYGDLAVVMPDESSSPMVRRFLDKFNVVHTFVIREETEFQPDLFTPDRWELAKGYKNVLMLVVLGDDTKATKAARRSVSGESWQRMEDSGGGIVQINDPWSTYQFMVVVAARDRNSLGSVLNRNAERLREMFRENNRDRMLRRNRYDGLDSQLMTTLWDRFGFFMELPTELAVNQSEPDGFPGVEMLQNGPSRGVTVSWMDNDNPANLLFDREALVAMRAGMGTGMHSEELVPETLVWSDAEIGGVACLRLTGAWNSTRFAGGGPFWCYFVPDPVAGRIFCVDLLVFAPGLEKMNYFRRLDAVASTFSTTRPQP